MKFKHIRQLERSNVKTLIGARIEKLGAEFLAKSLLLQEEFYAKILAIVREVNKSVPKPRYPPVRSSSTRTRKAVQMDEDDTLNLTRHPSKRQRFIKLLEDKSGVWVRRDSDAVYKCAGPTDTADHFYMKQIGSNKVICVSLVTILSKWNHLVG